MTATRVGIFVVPDATDPGATLDQIVAADRSGLDVVGVQDHPYQRRFFDTWTLLPFAAARTERITFVLREKVEYLLLCRYDRGGPADVCELLLRSFRLAAA